MERGAAVTASTTRGARHRVKTLVPDWARPGILQVADAVDRIRRTAWRSTRGGPPVPPWSMRRRVGSPTLAAYVDVGQGGAADIERILATSGRPLSTDSRVLDWGCGSGRIALQLMQRGSFDLHGCDVDPDAISWLRRAVPDGARRFQVSGFSPPLPYPDEAFDVVYAVSVFTHLDEPDQLVWLGELARVMAPGATAILTTAGHHALEHPLWSGIPPHTAERLAPMLDRLDELGFIFVSYSDLGSVPRKYPGISGDYGLAYQSEAWTREQWSEVLAVEQVLPRALHRYQDAVVATKSS